MQDRNGTHLSSVIFNLPA